MKRCVKWVSPGGACGTGNTKCGGGSFCYHGVCTKWVGLGAHCHASHVRCGSMLTCRNGTCMRTGGSD